MIRSLHEAKTCHRKYKSNKLLSALFYLMAVGLKRKKLVICPVYKDEYLVLLLTAIS
jgi:hypothetical protein